MPCQRAAKAREQRRVCERMVAGTRGRDRGRRCLGQRDELRQEVLGQRGERRHGKQELQRPVHLRMRPAHSSGVPHATGASLRSSSSPCPCTACPAHLLLGTQRAHLNPKHTHHIAGCIAKWWCSAPDHLAAPGSVRYIPPRGTPESGLGSTVLNSAYVNARPRPPTHGSDLGLRQFAGSDQQARGTPAVSSSVGMPAHLAQDVELRRLLPHALRAE